MGDDDVVANITSEIISKNNTLQESLAFSFVLKYNFSYVYDSKDCATTLIFQYPYQFHKCVLHFSIFDTLQIL